MARNIAAGKNTDIPGTSQAKYPSIAPMPQRPKFPSNAPGGTRIRNLEGQIKGGIGIQWDGLNLFMAMPKTVQGDMQEATQKAIDNIREEMVQYAQDNAPWRDVTGDARAFLHSPATFKESDGTWTIVLAHGVTYGLYLETRDGGALGIINKTLEEFSQRLGAEIQSNLRSKR